ncbi:MAG: hypothetical protein JEZ04_11815 [Spirochaetales bacterium]|nr:hypothetical protein [Spirochaetales bacterium]
MRKKDLFIKAARRKVRYTLSLPERIIRSLAALAGGTTSFLTDNLFPESIRKTTIYNVSIGMMQRFVVEQVAGMKREEADKKKELGDDYFQRKMVGTALEAAGLLAMRFSPLWVFAIAADAAGGSKVFLQRLVKHLKDNDIISRDAKVTELLDVLEAVQEASGRSAVSIDAPPLSREKLSDLANEMKNDYGRVFKTTANLIPRLDTIWANMEQLAKRENISIERLGGVITVDALFWSRKGLGMVSAAGRTGAELFDEKILESYRKTLKSVSEKGIENYMSVHMRPFVKSAKSHFDPGRETWIEKGFRKRKKDGN